jgi:YggT family protein
MFVLGNFLIATADLLRWLLTALEIVVIIRVVLSWANADIYNGFVRVIHALSEPLLAPVRRWLPPWKWHGLDFSPLVVLLALHFVRIFLISTLMEIAYRLKQ